MFSHLVTSIEPLLQNYGALGVFLASIIEEVVAPIPSTIVVFTSGILLTSGLTGTEALLTIALKIMLPASLGISIGSLFPYYLAKVGETVAINRFGKLLGIEWSAIEKAKAWTEKSKHDELLLLLARMIPVLPSVAISVTCGLVRYPVKKFLILSFLGSLPRSFFLGTLGWWGGAAYQQYAEQMSGVEKIVLIAIAAAAVVGYLVLRKRAKRRLSSK
ncbi:MAG: VTT domain-containing protein [Candidatus Peribacteraceae bacterium]